MNRMRQARTPHRREERPSKAHRSLLARMQGEFEVMAGPCDPDAIGSLARDYPVFGAACRQLGIEVPGAEGQPRKN